MGGRGFGHIDGCEPRLSLLTGSNCVSNREHKHWGEHFHGHEFIVQRISTSKHNQISNEVMY